MADMGIAELRRAEEQYRLFLDYFQTEMKRWQLEEKKLKQEVAALRFANKRLRAALNKVKEDLTDV